MRTAASALLVIIALLVGAVAGPSLWLQRNVVDVDGFTALAGPLGSDKDFQTGLSTLVASQTVAQLNLPPQLSELAATIIRGAAQGIYSEPGYGQAWTETLRRSHKLTFDAAGNDAVQGDVLIDVAPLVTLVAAQVSGQLAASLPDPGPVVVSVQQPAVAKVLPVMSTAGAWGGWLAGAAVVLLLLGILSARRRSLAALLAAVGIATVALAWQLGSDTVAGLLAGLPVGPVAAQQFGEGLGAVAQNSWQGGITAVFWSAAVLAVLGVGGLMVGRRRTT